MLTFQLLVHYANFRCVCEVSSQLLSIENFFEVFTVVLASTSLSSPLDTRWLLMWWEEKKDLQLYRWIQEKKGLLGKFHQIFFWQRNYSYFFSKIWWWSFGQILTLNLIIIPARVMTWSRTTFFRKIFFVCEKPQGWHELFFLQIVGVRLVFLLQVKFCF